MEKQFSDSDSESLTGGDIRLDPEYISDSDPRLLLKPKKPRTEKQQYAFEKAKEFKKKYAEQRKVEIEKIKETYKKKPYVKKADRVVKEEE
ncbi:MAG: hypothetical protein ACOVNU_05230 [Candidatus Kapaibacteriota bacterium]